MAPAAAQVWGTVPEGVAAATLQLDGGGGATGGDAVNVSVVVDVATRTWSAVLPPQPAGYNRSLTVSAAGKGSVTTTVHFGHVILCSGQSNMGMDVGYGAPDTIP